MSLMNLLQQAQGGKGLAQLASQFGIDEAQAGKLTEMLAPTIGQAAKKSPKRRPRRTARLPYRRRPRRIV